MGLMGAACAIDQDYPSTSLLSATDTCHISTVAFLSDQRILYTMIA